MKPKNHEEKVLSPYVPPLLIVASQKKFPKFIPSMENLMDLLKSYTYDSTKKVS